MICKNEQANIADLMEDVCPVLDEVIVVDTGSTDETLNILKSKQEKYPNLIIDHYKWHDDFSAARNYSFTKASKEWVFWVDGDDRVDSGKLRHFKDNVLDDPQVDCWLMDYIYSKLPDGSPQTTLGRERFLRRAKKPVWAGAIHETIYIGNYRQKHYFDLKIDHNRMGKIIEGNRNLKILEKEHKHKPKDARTAYYYGKELFDSVQSEKARTVLEHYLTLSGRYYDDECNARFRLARIYLAEKNHGQAINIMEPVYHLDNTRARAGYYFIRGQVEQDLRNFKRAIWWYEGCILEVPPPPRVLTMEYFTWHPRKKIAECYLAIGDYRNALKWAQAVEEILPGDPGNNAWMKSISSLQLLPKTNHHIVSLEFGCRIRIDSYVVGEDILQGIFGDGTPVSDRLKFDCQKTPLRDESITMVVVDNKKVPLKETNDLARIIKPGGVLWTTEAWERDPKMIGVDFNYLGESNYYNPALKTNTTVHTYIRIDSAKPTLGLITGDEKSAQYRYRIKNLMYSAMKSAYPVIPFWNKGLVEERKVDVLVGLDLSGIKKDPATTYVLEICEKLPNYHTENADVLNASSPLLAEYLQEKYPNKKIINVDDHFEMDNGGWL
jgi:glycosyltransferase involved in cell wall biosynthesis